MGPLLSGLVFCLVAGVGACSQGYQMTELTCEQADACARPGATDGAGGGGAGGAMAGAAGTAAAGDDCSNVPCLQQAETLMAGCLAAGPCISQKVSITPPTSVSSCFDNGVRVVGTMAGGGQGDSFTLTTTYKVKKGDALCYTRTFATHTPPGGDAGASTVADITTQDASGAIVAIVHLDEHDTPTVICPGRLPTVPAFPCGYAASVRTAFLVQTPAPTCTAGACTF